MTFSLSTSSCYWFTMNPVALRVCLAFWSKAIWSACTKGALDGTNEADLRSKLGTKLFPVAPWEQDSLADPWFYWSRTLILGTKGLMLAVCSKVADLSAFCLSFVICVATCTGAGLVAGLFSLRAGGTNWDCLMAWPCLIRWTCWTDARLVSDMSWMN